jgi:predicted glycogen debranching enzyme
MTVRFGPQLCGTLAEAANREWLVADGVGGYAMGTVAGLRTRRYHGLLIVAVAGPARRMLGLAALEPVLVLGDARIRLATDEWGSGVVDPRGHELLASFDLADGVPRWRWQVGGTVVERELAAAHGSPAVAVVHRLLASDGPAALELTPLCTWRDVHGERHADGAPELTSDEDGFVFESAYRVEGPGWQPGGAWYRDIRAREEAARGLADCEDLWAAGTFQVELAPGETHELTAAAAPFDDQPPKATAIVARARERARELIRASGAVDEVDAQLVLAADQFAITTGGRPTAVAGYPWFGEWSRDLMTSYEGLYLATGRHDEGREVLRSAAATVSEGMLANTADTGSLEYNTVDGTLWFVHAVGRHVTIAGDDDLGAELAPVIELIIDHHLEGTRFGIVVDPNDGLLRQGAEGWALTWMDARVDGSPITQRAGKPVEVNALWLRALDVAAQLTGNDVGRDRCLALREQAAASFTHRFVRPDGAGLFDVVDGPEGDDSSLRPNQLLAVALPNGPLDEQSARSVVEVCGRSLLTPLGLRSLAPDDPRYRPYHRGGPADRDAAYHQGTVWPWLLGPYVDAARTLGVPLDGILDGIEAHLGDWGLGSISETADGAEPHAATGCPFQAWSVAEVLRVRREPQPARPKRKKSLAAQGGRAAQPAAGSGVGAPASNASAA